MDDWPALSYDDWGPCCDTVHALTQLLGKFAAATAPPEPQLQHDALRLTARGWETAPLPAPAGNGAFTVTLDLAAHLARVEHSGGRNAEIAVIRRPVAEITAEVLAAVERLAGKVAVNPEPQEVEWTVGLDVDDEHRHYEPGQVATYFAAATQAALVLAEFRAPFQGRSTPVNAWWGSFDLAVSLFSGEPAAPPSDDFIMRNAMNAQEVAVGWWPGNRNSPGAAFYAYAHPAPDGYDNADLSPAAAHWDQQLGEFILRWEDVRSAQDPHGDAVRFARSAFAHACQACDWSPDLAASMHRSPIT
jgi:hypothetical protein